MQFGLSQDCSEKGNQVIREGSMWHTLSSTMCAEVQFGKYHLPDCGTFKKFLSHDEALVARIHDLGFNTICWIVSYTTYFK